MAFTGKVILITGASSGIGAATAKQFASLGATLALAGRNVDNLKQVASDCSTKSIPLLLQGELTNEKDTKAILDKTIEHFGRLDVLVNNAGIIETGSIENTTLDQYDRLMNTNVRSVYHLSMLAVPHLVKTKGNIVNVSSVNGMRSFPNVLAYCMSKAAVDQFTRCVALELAGKQVRVNSVNPGVTLTNLQKRGGMNDEQYEAFLQRTKDTHALGRPGNPDEVAKTITFLASEDASFITGASLPVDGGRHAMCPR
ncbi:3-oxoacyl-[acyl-carrier-protein] reductase FabG-like [Diabrotica undecimpunctata]|uniref:3-oxoacyl-[acyl-carrier-protein] reductase FabG-like n=1 Tax=Diabrotica undecimpunctata TaxID=50387 RepID=UPI003B63F6D0